MKYYIIAGEASGDLHGSNLASEIFSNDTEAQIQGWGGYRMANNGVEIKKHIKDLAFMGFIEVVMNLKTIMRNIKQCKSEIESFQPDALILIDYPGFNMRIAAWAREKGLRVYYYISPQIWAWKRNRVKKIRRDVRKIFVILPFEKDFYKKYGVEAEFVGHPLLDAIENFKSDTDTEDFGNGKPILALLPGSRKQELKKMLPLMVEASKKYAEEFTIVIGGLSNVKELYTDYLNDHISIVYDKSYRLLNQAKAAFVTSGTATLETALFSVPEVVCYKASPISYHIAKRLIKVKYISLVNLIADAPVVKELIQHELNIKNMHKEMDLLLNDSPELKKMKDNYGMIHEKLGGIGASKRVATKIIEDLTN
ncbi:MAG: lipid-A-disaccharide synthase [Marinilabiliales bacterium]|nr:MAG: lipid-A-disaccharide synthase [Marinilabiliales bacterium]